MDEKYEIGSAGRGNNELLLPEEPTYDEVNKFFEDENFRKSNGTGSVGSRSGITEDAYLKAQDQVIRGWVYPNNIVQEDGKIVQLFDMRSTIPDYEQTYAGFNDWYNPVTPYGILYVKGHGLNKRLYFEWSGDVVFFCPNPLKNGGNEKQVRTLVESEKDISTNRFFRDQAFHYPDRKRKRWRSFLFGEFNQLHDLFKIQVTSQNCEKSLVTAINRLR